MRLASERKQQQHDKAKDGGAKAHQAGNVKISRYYYLILGYIADQFMLLQVNITGVPYLAWHIHDCLVANFFQETLQAAGSDIAAMKKYGR
jgi:hypothetical protein